MRNWYLTMTEHGRHIQRADINEDNYICNVESNDEDARLIESAPKLLHLSKILIWVCEDRISMLTEELEECLDDYYELDIVERIEHYKALKKEADEVVWKCRKE